MTDATTAVSLPLFYKEPVAINAETHRELTVSPSPAGYAFATRAHTVMLNAAEFIEAGHEYPIIFSSGADGSAGPLALLGLEAGENLYVDNAGVWNANYIPAYVRRYPFIPADTGAPEFPVCVDWAFDGLNNEGGQRIFDEAGEPTEYCRFIQAFVSDFQRQHALGRAFSAKLRELELFRSMDANIKLIDGRAFVLQEFLIVDENKLARLGDVAVLELFRKGYLALIYAHLASLRNLAKLSQLKGATTA